MDSSIVFAATVSVLLVTGFMIRKFFKNQKDVHDDAVVVITGGSAGIGLAYAQSVARHHKPKRIVLLARNAEILKKAQQDVLSARCSISTIVDVMTCDVSDDKQVEIVSSKLSDVTVLVNCAGLSYPTELEKLSVNQIDTMINTNLRGSILLTRRLIPFMKNSSPKKNFSKSIVFVSSQAGQVGLYGYSAYSATKFALRGLAEALQMELKPYQINVSVAFPPDTKTEAFVKENEIKPEATSLMSGGEPMEAS